MHARYRHADHFRNLRQRQSRPDSQRHDLTLLGGQRSQCLLGQGGVDPTIRLRHEPAPAFCEVARSCAAGVAGLSARHHRLQRHASKQPRGAAQSEFVRRPASARKRAARYPPRRRRRSTGGHTATAAANARRTVVRPFHPPAASSLCHPLNATLGVISKGMTERGGKLGMDKGQLTTGERSGSFSELPESAI